MDPLLDTTLPMQRIGGDEAEQLLARLPDTQPGVDEEVIWHDYLSKVVRQLSVVDARTRERARVSDVRLVDVLSVQLMPYGSATIEERASWIGVSPSAFEYAQRRLARIIQTLQEQGF